MGYCSLKNRISVSDISNSGLLKYLCADFVESYLEYSYDIKKEIAIYSDNQEALKLVKGGITGILDKIDIRNVLVSSYFNVPISKMEEDSKSKYCINLNSFVIC